MSGIDQQLLQSSQIEAAPIKSDRLDVANEEEATSHWQCLDRNLLHFSYPTAFQDDEDSEDDNENENTGKTAAAASFLSSFQKAGSSTKNIHKPQHLENTKTHPDVDDEEEDLNLLKEKHRHVEPLDKCNHTLKTYPRFRKVFHHPKNTDDGKQWRSDYDVSCSIDTVDPIFSFAELGSCHDDVGDSTRTAILPQTILEYLDENGYKEPTLVQSQCIPLALYGKDLLVTSHTGSGKTLAYLLPLIAHILDQPPIQPGVDGPIALILSPTRELTKQISIVGKKILKLVDAVAYAVTGGMGTYEMTKDLRKGCSVVITTPGELDFDSCLSEDCGQ
jgi:Rad3-related DNA helicase